MIGLAAFCILVGLLGLGVCGILMAYYGIVALKQMDRDVWTR